MNTRFSSLSIYAQQEYGSSETPSASGWVLLIGTMAIAWIIIYKVRWFPWQQLYRRLMICSPVQRPLDKRQHFLSRNSDLN